VQRVAKYPHDVEKFEKFYRDNFEKVVQKVLRSKWVWCRDEAEDIAQDIFKELWLRFDDNYFEYNTGYFYKYLVKFRLMNFIKKKAGYLNRLENVKLAELLDRQEDERIKDTYERRLELFELMLGAIPKTYRDYFRVAYWKGIKVADKTVMKLDKSHKERFYDYVIRAYEKFA